MQSHTTPLLSIIYPVRNEAANLPELLEATSHLMAQLAIDCEVLFVDDHSTDASPELLQAACAAEPRFRYLRLAQNAGSHVAILAGIEHSRGDCAVFLAADLQDPPALIPQMLAHWSEGNHVVWAVRACRDNIAWHAKLLANTFYWLMNRFSEVRQPPQGADFALLDRRVIRPLLESAGADPSLGANITSLGFRQCEIPYTKQARKHGKSSWTLGKKLKAFADAFVGFSFAPIRLMSYAGLLTALFGFGYALFIVGLRIFNLTPIHGWASLMVTMLILGGMQMTMLGVLGEYVCRTLREARRRPRYVLEHYLSAADRDGRRSLRERDADEHAHEVLVFEPHAPSRRKAS